MPCRPRCEPGWRRRRCPWSPASCRRIWQKARAEGASLEAILARLDRAEQATLSRDRLSLPARVAAGDSLPARDWERPGPCRAEPGDPQPAR